MKYLAILLCLGIFFNFAYSEQTVSEKNTVEMKALKRKSKKMVNRIKESVCGELTGDSKLECLAKKTGNRVGEVADTVKDKTSEIKNKVDTH